MGNTLSPFGGGVDAVEGVFGNGRAPAVCRSAAGRRSDERGLSRVRHLRARSPFRLSPRPCASDKDRGSQVRNGLSAGGNRIRTIGPALAHVSRLFSTGGAGPIG